MPEALDCMRGAAEVYRAGGVSHWLPVAEESVARLEAKLATVGGDPPRSDPPPEAER
jgi:hypothetical protein